MAPKKQSAGPHPKRAVRATAKRAVSGPSACSNSSSNSFTAVKSPPNGDTKKIAESPPQRVVLPISSPPIATETSSSKSIIPETVAGRTVDGTMQNSAVELRNEAVSARNQTLAQENENSKVTFGIGTELLKNESIDGSGNANGGSLSENVEGKPKKKKKKVVVKVVKKIVKKRVPKSMLKGAVASSNKESTTEEVLDEDAEKISDCIVSPKLQEITTVKPNEESEDKILEKQPDNSDCELTITQQEVGNFDSSVSCPIKVENSDDVMTLSAGQAKNADLLEVDEKGKGVSLSEVPVDSKKNDGTGESDSAVPMPMEVVNVDVDGDKNNEFAVNLSSSMEVELLKTLDEERNEVSASILSVNGEKNDCIVEHSDSDTAMPMEVNLNVTGDRNVELDDFSIRCEEGEKEAVEKADGKIVLSGELEAVERRRRRKTEIFIGGLNTDAKEEDVRKIFEEVGDVVEVRMMINSKKGKNKGFAFVRYASATDAKKALEKYPKVEICGKQCSTAPVEGNDTLYLGNIDKKWTTEDVIKLLQGIGIDKIDKVTVMADPSNKERNRGFAFLELETNKDAQNALKKLQKKDIGKLQNIKVAWAEPLSEPDEEELLKVKSVYAEYLPSSWDEEKVRAHFTKFGEIENVVLSRNLQSSRRKDFAFVNFTSREAALACIESFKHETLMDEGSQVNVKVSLAKPLPKGKPHRKVHKSTNQEISKQKQVVQRTQKRVETKIKEIPVVQINNLRTADTRSSGTADLEQILAERALRKQMQTRLGTGMVNLDYSQVSPGQKRLFSTLGDNPNYSDLSAYTRVRVENSIPAGRPSYGEVSPVFSIAPPSYNRQQGANYSIGQMYSDYANNFQREYAPPYYPNVDRNYYRRR